MVEFPDEVPEPASFRVASLVAIGSVPVGFAWIHAFGTGSPAVIVAAGALVGLLYRSSPIPARNAGARVGLLAPIPEVAVQVLWPPTEVLILGHGYGALAFSIGAVVLVTGFGWLLGAVLCIVAAAVAGWLADRVQTSDTEGAAS